MNGSKSRGLHAYGNVLNGYSIRHVCIHVLCLKKQILQHLLEQQAGCIRQSACTEREHERSSFSTIVNIVKHTCQHTGAIQKNNFVISRNNDTAAGDDSRNLSSIARKQASGGRDNSRLFSLLEESLRKLLMNQNRNCGGRRMCAHKNTN